MKLERAKGTEDFPPEEKILRDEVINKLKSIFELYGYSPFETPIIERYDLLSAKAGAGQESDALKETFKLTDQGNRQLGLRFELTLSLARFIGMNPNIKMPFKRYEIGPVFRDGPIKLGRYREFWQCDVDIIGSNNMLADAELIMLTLDCFKILNLDAFIYINNRKLLKGILEFVNIKEDLADSVIISIDKLNKYGKDYVVKELKSKNISQDKINSLLKIFNIKGTNEQKIKSLKKILTNNLTQTGLNELETIISYFNKEQKKKIIFNVSLARGLGYYTGPIFEGYLKKSPIKNSICGGGRYDEMISSLLETDKEYPATGISFGLDVIADALKLTKIKIKKTVTKVYIIPIAQTKKSIELLQKLRSLNINADIDLTKRGISKNLDYANQLSIPYVIFIGEKELKIKKFKLRDMKTGKESLLNLKDLIKKLSVQ